MDNINFMKTPFGEGEDKAEINYPVNYDLKVIFASDEESGILQRNLELVLEDAEVPHEFVKVKNSRKGNFVSLTMNVTIDDAKQMGYLYERLKLLPGIRFAL